MTMIVLKNRILLYLSFIISLVCKAQLITTSPVEVPIGAINFNSEVIKKNKIKALSILIVDKPDGTVIVDKGASKGYEFDEDGYVTRYYFTILNHTENESYEVAAVTKRGRIIHPARTRHVTNYLNDTIFTLIKYDAKKRVIMKRVQAGDYYDAFYYEYNDIGQMKKELHCKETNVSDNPKEFKLGVQRVLSSETFEYIALTATQIKKRCLNDEGREYKTVIINYNDKGNKISESHEYMVSWMHQESTFQYEKDGKLLKKTFAGNEGNPINEASIFEYEKNASVTIESKFKDNLLIEEVNYLYDEDHNLIKSEVNRDHKNSSIEIVKYFYSFY